MRLLKEEPDSIGNLKELIKFLQGPDMGFSKSGGNGLAKIVGQNLEISDTYFYGSQKALDKLEKAWTGSGHYASWFKKTYGITFDLVSSRSDEGDSNGGKVHIVLKPTFGKKESMKTRKESTSYEKDIDDNKPIIVKGVKGMKSTPFTKKFKNMAAYDKWADSDDFGNYEIYEIRNEGSMNLNKEARKLLNEAVGLVDISGWSDQDLKRANRADDPDEPVDFRKALYSVYIGKRLVKSGLPGPRATAYAAAIRKNKPDANILVVMEI